MKIPGVKVNRNEFLAKTFAGDPTILNDIIAEGPVKAEISRSKLDQIAKKLILVRTSESSLASFAAGIPGGLAMAATVPADLLQFFGMSLRLAQELSYLYGAQDLWQDGEVDDERVRNQLILYAGVMFGISGASAGVRMLSSQLAKTTLKKLPQKALTKTFWYPLVKQIGKAIGLKVTKTTVAQSISKAVPVVGGVISGGLNFASMMPMANRLQNTLDKSCFEYTQEEFDADIVEVESIQEESIEETEHTSKSDAIKQTIKESSSLAVNKLSSIAGKIKSKKRNANSSNEASSTTDVLETIEKLKHLEEIGAISQDEFEEKKRELLARL